MAVGHRLSVHPAARGGDAACSSGAVLTPTFEVVAETGSTNADFVARLRASEALGEGHWLRAERQTGGRGRRGRPWDSPAGNLFCSTAVSLKPSDPPAHTLSFVTALAVHDLLMKELAVEARAECQLKWPNDVLVGGGKICGILLEQVGNHVVVGIGINIAYAPELPDRKTARIGALNGNRNTGPAEILAELAPLFAARVAQWRAAGLGVTLAEWTARAHPAGSALRVSGEGQAAIHGVFAGLDDDGSLRLRLDDGSVRAIHAADVALI